PGYRCALLYCGFGPFDVTLTFARDRLDVTHGKILELLLHRFVSLLFSAARKTAYRDRMRSANGCGGGHCRHTCCNGDETTCASRGRAGGSDVNDDRHRGPEEALHNLLRRIE